MNIESRFNQVYKPLLSQFVSNLATRPYADYKGIPHVFLPAWGKNYQHALVRMAIVGKETRGWGPNLDEFIPLYANGSYSLDQDRVEFQNLDFRDASWMGDRPTRGSFWGFWMNVLSKVYGIDNWEELKKGQYEFILDSFVWGNANSIETETSAGLAEEVRGSEGYWFAKQESAVFDSLALLRSVFDPHVVILTCSNAERDSYLGSTMEFVETVDSRVNVYRDGQFLVFHMCHPNGQRYHPGGSDEFARIVRNLLCKYKLFCPLPNVFNQVLPQESIQILVNECRGLDVYSMIAKVAHELRNQRSCMTARRLCLDILNKAGATTRWGTEYTGNTRGPCKLVSSAWKHYDAAGEKSVAENIAYAFKTVSGYYAYE